jgi:hypothetical protein
MQSVRKGLEGFLMIVGQLHTGHRQRGELAELLQVRGRRRRRVDDRAGPGDQNFTCTEAW